MKVIIAAAFLALAFTTGFTCSKNSPEQSAPATTAPSQEQMAAPTTEAMAPDAPPTTLADH